MDAGSEGFFSSTTFLTSGCLFLSGDEEYNISCIIDDRQGERQLSDVLSAPFSPDIQGVLFPFNAS